MNLSTHTLDLVKFCGLVGASALIILFLTKWIYENLWLRKKALLQTNLAYEEVEFIQDKNAFLKRRLSKRILKVRRYKHRLEILQFNPNLNKENISRETPTIERIFKRRVVQVDFRNYGLFNHKEKVVFIFENFPKILKAEQLKESLEPGSYWLGQNARGNNLIQNKKLPFLFCGGGMGSGKSVALGSYTISLASSFTSNNLRQPDIVLVSSEKMTEFIPLINRLSKTGEVKTFNVNSLDEIKALNSNLENHIKKCGAFFQVIKNERIIARHWLDLSHPQKPEPKIYIFDEAPEYLGDLLKIKVTKDSSREELEAHEINEQKRKLGFQIDRVFKTLRETGTFVTVSSQTALSSDLQAISFQNLKQNFILGRGITPQVLNLYGLTELSQQHLDQGCFYFYNGREYGILKAPFLTAEDDK